MILGDGSLRDVSLCGCLPEIYPQPACERIFAPGVVRPSTPFIINALLMLAHKLDEVSRHCRPKAALLDDYQRLVMAQHLEPSVIPVEL